MEHTKRYSFTNYFYKVFYERVGIELDDDTRAYILSVCQNSKPHRKIDNKGRNSEYFTMRVNDQLITVVCDGIHTRLLLVLLKRTIEKSLILFNPFGGFYENDVQRSQRQR